MGETAQAKTIRNARATVAASVALLVARSDRAGIVALGIPRQRASEFMRGAPFTSQDLAALLGVSLPTVNSWLLPKGAKAHRPMSQTARLLLARILADCRAIKKGAEM